MTDHLFTTGNNDDGQLGLGDTTDRLNFTLVDWSSWKWAAAGSFHTLGVKTDGTLWAWGWNGYGQLGLGDTTNRLTPTPVYFYENYGVYISPPIHIEEGVPDYTTLSFKAHIPEDTTLKIQLRSASTKEELSNAAWYGPTFTTDYYNESGASINPIHDGDRWIQYKIIFTSDPEKIAGTPWLESITINYKVATHKTFLYVSNDGKIGIGTDSPTKALHVVGDIYKTGTSNFVEDINETHQLVYASLEGGEVGIYWRGTGLLENGRARIEFLEHFKLALSKEAPIVAMVTPTSRCQMYVKEKTHSYIIVVKF